MNDDKSTSFSINDLTSAIKSLGKPAAGKLKEPEPFLGKDPKKLKAFLFQCLLYFQSSSNFQNNSKQVTFALSYLWDVAQELFEPRISGFTKEPPLWLENWDLFVEELQSNFGPFDKTTDVEHALMNLWMKDNQRISEYLV